jgi:hypothetical protein
VESGKAEVENGMVFTRGSGEMVREIEKDQSKGTKL